MSFPKLLAVFAAILFTVIGAAAIFKGRGDSPLQSPAHKLSPIEVHLEKEVRMVAQPTPSKSQIVAVEIHQTITAPPLPIASPPSNSSSLSKSPDTPLPEANRIEEFFNKNDPKFPIVQTVKYKSRVDWQKGRPAWLSDYAAHYKTSRHFIARSLNGKPDYFKQDIVEGDKFNVLNPDKDISFYLLIDASRSKMWFYYFDHDTHDKVLVKTYSVGLGRVDSSKVSCSLTPLGKYTLGSRIAIYKPKSKGFHNGKEVEMVRVFGTRWIPFEQAVGDCTAPPEGFGLHGVPWVPNSKGELVASNASLGKYESDGCIRLATEDIEELFAIIISRPTEVEIVKDFHDATAL